MYVCICHGITDSQIRHAAEEGGISDVHELTMRTGCGSNCGGCLTLAEEILREASAVPLPLPILRAA